MSKISDKWTKLSNSKKIILISILVYSLAILFHYIYAHFINTNFVIIISDQINFYNRGQGVIQGQLPYRDFYTNAAPLSPYLWGSLVLISMIGSDDFSYEIVNSTNYVNFPNMMLLSYVLRIFFALCIILSGIILYKLESKRKNKHAFEISLLYTINPFFLYLVSFWGSDECIIPLLILLPIYLYERGNNTLATICLVLGAGLKYFPVLLAPLIWIYSKEWLDRIIQSLIFICLTLTIFLPFYFLAPEKFLAQFADTIGEQGNQGILTIFQSVFDLKLNEQTILFQALTVVIICIIGLYFYLRRNRWNYKNTAALFLVYLLFYPKVQISYLVLVLPFIFIFILEKGVIRWVAIIFYLSGIVNGEMANILIERTREGMIWIILSWTNICCFYLANVFLISIMLKNFKMRNTEINSS